MTIRQAKTSKFMIYNATNRLEWKLNLTMKWFCAVATQNCSISKHARYHCCIASWPTTNHKIKPDETVTFPNKMHLLQEIFLQILFLSAVSAVLKQLAGFLSQTIKRTYQSCVGKVCLTILISQSTIAEVSHRRSRPRSDEVRHLTSPPAPTWWTGLLPKIPVQVKYRKIPKISPGAYIFQRPFLRGLFLEGLINGGKFAFQNRLGLYLEGNLRLKIDWAKLALRT